MNKPRVTFVGISAVIGLILIVMAFFAGSPALSVPVLMTGFSLIAISSTSELHVPSRKKLDSWKPPEGFTDSDDVWLQRQLLVASGFGDEVLTHPETVSSVEQIEEAKKVEQTEAKQASIASGEKKRTQRAADVKPERKPIFRSYQRQPAVESWWGDAGPHTCERLDDGRCIKCGWGWLYDLCPPEHTWLQQSGLPKCKDCGRTPANCGDGKHQWEANGDCSFCTSRLDELGFARALRSMRKGDEIAPKACPNGIHLWATMSTNDDSAPPQTLCRTCGILAPERPDTVAARLCENGVHTWTELRVLGEQSAIRAYCGECGVTMPYTPQTSSTLYAQRRLAQAAANADARWGG